MNLRHTPGQQIRRRETSNKSSSLWITLVMPIDGCFDCCLIYRYLLYCPFPEQTTRFGWGLIDTPIRPA